MRLRPPPRPADRDLRGVHRDRPGRRRAQARLAHAARGGGGAAGVTGCWQALVDRAQLKPGQKVLVHAGSGGLGSTAIQLAKHLGATVATTASGKNAELVRSLGADIVVDYRKEDFADVLSGYDVVLDSLGGQNLEKSLTVLKPGGHAISVTGPPDPGFAKQLGAPQYMGVVMGLLSRKVQSKPGNSDKLLIPVHAGQRRPAARTRQPLRRRPTPPDHRQDVPI